MTQTPPAARRAAVGVVWEVLAQLCTELRMHHRVQDTGPRRLPQAVCHVRSAVSGSPWLYPKRESMANTQSEPNLKKRAQKTKTMKEVSGIYQT